MWLPWFMSRKQWADVVARATPAGFETTRRRRLRPGPDRHGPKIRRAELRHMAEAAAVESAAYLMGTYAETVAARGRAVPKWAWTNLLAHGSADELRRQAQALEQGRLHTRAWLGARGYLAAEIIDRVDRGDSLEAIQHDVLLPIERSLMASGHGLLRDGSVTQWVAEVRAALGAHDAVVARGGTAPCT